MFVRGVVLVELLGRVIVLGPTVDRERGRDLVCFVLGELEEEDCAYGAGGLGEPRDRVGEDGLVGFSEAALNDEGRVLAVDDIDASVGFLGGERHVVCCERCWRWRG